MARQTSAFSIPPSALPMLNSISRKPAASAYRSARACGLTGLLRLAVMAASWYPSAPASRANAAKSPPYSRSGRLTSRRRSASTFACSMPYSARPANTGRDR
jgi:hypothetical protein